MTDAIDTPNLSWWFYKHYFDDTVEYTIPGEGIKKLSFDYVSIIDQAEVENVKKITEEQKENNGRIFRLINRQILSTDFNKLTNINGIDHANTTFPLKTVYPGLLTGSGYQHGTKTAGEFKLGFFFDYTTGIPYLPGSSVKGVCRSVFPQFHSKNIKYRNEKTGFVCSLLYKITGNEFFKIEEDAVTQFSETGNPQRIFIDSLEKNIFQGLSETGEPVGLYKRDIFYDSRIENVTDKMLYDDSITPHIFRDDPDKSDLKNPVPLLFLKVGPGVTFSFRFNFNTIVINGIEVTGEIKKQLMFQIIKENGIGAKTNVGYGQFESKENDGLLHEHSEEKEINYLAEKDIDNYIPRARIISKNQQLAAKITRKISHNSYEVLVILMIDKNGNRTTKALPVTSGAKLETGKYILVTAKGITNGLLQSVKFEEQ